MSVGNKRIKEANALNKVILVDEDGEVETLDKSMIVSLDELEDGTADMGIRFCNLDMEEIDRVLYGLKMLLNDKV